MDKNANNKALNFFKKEGFYVILFVCLCIVATVASITANNNKKIASNQQVALKEQANTASILKKQQKEYEGALQVKKENLAKDKALKAVPNTKEVATTSVSKTITAQFVKPVANGLLARGYSKDIDSVVWKTDGSYRTNLGIDIQAKTGAAVVAVMDGIVKAVGTDVDGQNGYMVEIDHQNGFVTKYTSLDKKMLVKKGDKVTKEQPIGTVANTSLNSYKEDYGSHLHFEVLQNSKNIDPAKYVKYDKYQPKVTKAATVTKTTKAAKVTNATKAINK
ncbi:M23 family metallopeptidase [Clostridium psychrophilum]|uniref:M23 family metallopeptidase n=1 Tax=Clostridium psychrophilum TaxID=132926 RepID=UPI001C0CD486|nr:M23 family metallopeptidase [Clostridium psychrophilum]MBU3179847.1 M23 family metallopeptidase [Clostridium psychrophilum]